MWIYKEVTREAFEKRKKYVEQIICEQGAEIVMIHLPYKQTTISICDGNQEINCAKNKIFKFKNNYFRVDEVLFRDKPFIVLECGSFQDLMRNTMEDAEPFPYDLSDDEIVKEVRYAMEIE